MKNFVFFVLFPLIVCLALFYTWRTLYARPCNQILSYKSSLNICLMMLKEHKPSSYVIIKQCHASSIQEIRLHNIFTFSSNIIRFLLQATKSSNIVRHVLRCSRFWDEGAHTIEHLLLNNIQLYLSELSSEFFYSNYLKY